MAIGGMFESGVVLHILMINSDLLFAEWISISTVLSTLLLSNDHLMSVNGHLPSWCVFWGVFGR